MEGYFPLKMKRKELEDVNDDFSDFSICSPARKIRRLDAELPPIMEDEECEIPMMYEQSVPQKPSFLSNLGGLKIEELPSEENQERAIVLFKPMDNPLLQQTQSSFSLSVAPQFISGIKKLIRGSDQLHSWRVANEDAETDDSNSCSNNGCLAVVPWVPSSLSSVHVAEFPQIDNSEMMDAEPVGEATMDVDCGTSTNQMNSNEAGAGGHLHQWQQQHCMIPQLPHNPTAPIVWYQ